MDARLVALELVLEGLGEERNIGTVDDRLRIQKAVYLAQMAGVGMGYTYSWYLKGPYSPSLTRDYYELDGCRRADGRLDVGAQRLNSSVMAKIERVREVLAKPAHINLPTAHWYELLASLHFLLNISKYERGKAFDFLRQNKPHLSEYLTDGLAHLQRFGLA